MVNWFIFFLPLTSSTYICWCSPVCDPVWISRWDLTASKKTEKKNGGCSKETIAPAKRGIVCAALFPICGGMQKKKKTFFNNSTIQIKFNEKFFLKITFPKFQKRKKNAAKNRVKGLKLLHEDLSLVSLSHTWSRLGLKALLLFHT